MSPTKPIRTRTLFTAAAAMVLGLQVVPWPTAVMVQAEEPSELILQEEAQPIELVSRREQRRNRRPTPRVASENNEKSTESGDSSEPPLIQQPPQAQQMPRRNAVKQYPKSEVQRELEKLYTENGMDVPEMVDARNSQPATNAAKDAAGAKTPGQSAQGTPQGQPSPQTVQGQPSQGTDGQSSPPAAPKKRNFLSRFFSKDDAPLQPPVETPYIPPTAPAATPPAEAGANGVVQTPGVVSYDNLFESETTSSADAGATSQPPATNTVVLNNGNAASVPSQNNPPAKNSAANSIPQMDFNAPVEQPDLNNVNLGQPAPLTAAAESAQPVPAAQPAAPADPFSDSALFPSSTPAPAANTLNNVAKVPVQEQAAPAQETPTTPAAPPEAPKVTAEAEENPYSGLSLDDNPFTKPAPRSTAAATPRQLPLEEVKVVPQPSLTTPPALMTPPSETSNSATEEEPPLVVNQREPRRPARLAPVGSRQTRAKQEMIAARKGMPGLKGFCPVILRDERNLVDAQNQYRAVYNSKTYYLSSQEAVVAFQADPAKYAPAARGCDVIQLAISGEEIEGSLDYAVWYKGRLYMFASAETMDTFVSAPSSHATLD